MRVLKFHYHMIACYASALSHTLSHNNCYLYNQAATLQQPYTHITIYYLLFSLLGTASFAPTLLPFYFPVALCELLIFVDTLSSSLIRLANTITGYTKMMTALSGGLFIR